MAKMFPCVTGCTFQKMLNYGMADIDPSYRLPSMPAICSKTKSIAGNTKKKTNVCF